MIWVHSKEYMHGVFDNKINLKTAINYLTPYCCCCILCMYIFWMLSVCRRYSSACRYNKLRTLHTEI